MKNKSVITRLMENTHHLMLNGQDLGYDFQTNAEGSTVLSFGLSRTFCFALTSKDAEGKDLPAPREFNKPEIIKAVYLKALETRATLGQSFSVSVFLIDRKEAITLSAERITSSSGLQMNLPSEQLQLF